MRKKNAQVEAYIDSAADFAKPVLIHLQALVHKTCPEVNEVIKWKFPHFEYHGLLCSMAAFKQHCSFGFWKARLMDDYAKVLGPANLEAMGNFGKIKSLKDLPPDKILVKMIREAMRLNESGVKVTRTKASPKKLIVPKYFIQALSRNKKAMNIFDGFSYSHQKDYIEWITEAKTEETREKRIRTTLLWLAEGKPRHWKYAK
jgi:uncharacterized protein YdeI (YjbR/CyaY-like superfamily)